jgi:integrase
MIDVPGDLKPIAEDKIAAKDKRESFRLDQLKSFFAGPFYKAAMNGDLAVKSKRDFAWRFWLPILALYSGMRGNEMCQMLTTDIKCTAKGTWYFQVDVTSDEEGKHTGVALTKTLKTENSKRMIPIHSVIENLGFLDFVKRRTATAGTDRLFSGLKPDKYGNLFSYPSKRFNESFLVNETFHSFRHTWGNAMRQTNASPDTLQALGAWEQGELTSANYGELSQPDSQKQHIEAVKFGDLDISALSVVPWGQI